VTLDVRFDVPPGLLKNALTEREVRARQPNWLPSPDTDDDVIESFMAGVAFASRFANVSIKIDDATMGVIRSCLGADAGPAAAAGPTAPTLRETKRVEARIRGYEGDACGVCGNFTLSRNGTCLKCDTCGNTTGCS
jgi:hypothetical protein